MDKHLNGARNTLGIKFTRTILKHFKWSHLAQKNLNFMHGLKSAIFSIFQKSVNFNSIYFFIYETIVRSSASSFDHSDPDTSSVARIDAQSWEEHLRWWRLSLIIRCKSILCISLNSIVLHLKFCLNRNLSI